MLQFLKRDAGQVAPHANCFVPFRPVRGPTHHLTGAASMPNSSYACTPNLSSHAMCVAPSFIKSQAYTPNQSFHSLCVSPPTISPRYICTSNLSFHGRRTHHLIAEARQLVIRVQAKPIVSCYVSEPTTQAYPPTLSFHGLCVAPKHPPSHRGIPPTRPPRAPH
jgi:hypothetical protein